mmetsp:Transcript_26946/g.58805  ORF Transcript_26946/g.58805 Transcript_26946/m.58805 type:complete len:486 (-) Transcript_26946:131-1588(-)|eukprot:CAMPEP_0118942470 /NCGR_PEP_ID=MMETSP1169-20130426/36218_1 /TAXON_ID=36882 /ORGANISM="Pyramimonas obovata, Strain CCMP722" /LENGTH=485 /DNA_ID=CAMNT_0006887491 /DNA_START=296 /DNA_END=1753 /DNA_ORIENTATION=+
MARIVDDDLDLEIDDDETDLFPISAPRTKKPPNSEIAATISEGRLRHPGILASDVQQESYRQRALGGSPPDGFAPSSSYTAPGGTPRPTVSNNSTGLAPGSHSAASSRREAANDNVDPSELLHRDREGNRICRAVVAGVTKPRIPGPAGLLSTSRLRDGDSVDGGEGFGGYAAGGENVVASRDPGPQDHVGFQSGAWHAALDTLDLTDPEDLRRSPLLAHAVRYILSRIYRAPVPQLLVLVTSFKKTVNGDATVTLQDPTGTIGGTIHQQALEAEPDIALNAVLVLQKVAVLYCGRSRYLTITLPMVVQVFSATTPHPREHRGRPDHDGPPPPKRPCHPCADGADGSPSAAPSPAARDGLPPSDGPWAHRADDNLLGRQHQSQSPGDTSDHHAGHQSSIPPPVRAGGAHPPPVEAGRGHNNTSSIASGIGVGAADDSVGGHQRPTVAGLEMGDGAGGRRGASMPSSVVDDDIDGLELDDDNDDMF